MEMRRSTDRPLWYRRTTQLPTVVAALETACALESAAAERTTGGERGPEHVHYEPKVLT